MQQVTYQALENEHLSRAVPGYFYITTRERNAWHATTSRQYRGPASLTCTLEGAQRVAEGWRAQGSAFTIQKVPGLHLQSEWSDLGLVEFHTSDSYSGWDHSHSSGVQSGQELRDVLDALGPFGRWRGVAPSPHSFVSAILDGEDVVEPLGPRAMFRAWSSYSHGGGCMLGWFEHTGRHKAAGVRKVARYLNGE